MKNLLLIVTGIATTIFISNASAQQELLYHKCDNVRAIVEALINPELNEEQKQLLQGVLRTPTVTNFNISLEPGDRQGKSLAFQRRHNVDHRSGGIVTSTGFRLQFGQTILDISDETTCETR